MNTRRTLAIALASLASLLAGALVQPATAAPIKWLAVQLGTHRFGHLSAPDAIVARAGPEDVGFSVPTEGQCGCGDGPQGPLLFDVARDGSIWLLDGLSHRLLVWRRNGPAEPVRSVPLPQNLRVKDFVLGRDGTIYATTGADAGRPNLYALTPTGRVRWKARTTIAIGNAQLHLGPDGALYTPSGGNPPPMAWTQLTTRAGRPLSLAEQRRRTSRYQPLPGGLRLMGTLRSAHEARFALIDRTGRTVRAWRVTSKTELGGVRAWPALVGGDLVVPLDVVQQTKSTFLWEHLVLRLAPSGVIRQRLALDGRAVLGDESDGTPLRIGPDGRLYQLRTNPKTGVIIARYSLGPPSRA
jgi:hypothetical protein